MRRVMVADGQVISSGSGMAHPQHRALMSAHAALPILVGSSKAARQQLARARRLDDVDGAIDSQLRALGVERAQGNAVARRYRR